MSRIIMSAIILAAAGITTMPASAAPVVEERQTSVRVDDLDLASQQGREKLDQRIAAAVRKVCSLEQNTGTLISRLDRQCMQKATRQVTVQVAAAIEAERRGG